MGAVTNTYAITSSTTFSEGPTTVTESALAVGQHVGIQLSTSDASTAANIDIQLPALFGTVSSVSGDTVVITDLEGFSRTIVVDSSTTYSKSGATASLSDIVVSGDIIAEGTVDANLTSLDATHVVIGVPSQPGGGPGIQDRVAAARDSVRPALTEPFFRRSSDASRDFPIQSARVSQPRTGRLDGEFATTALTKESTCGAFRTHEPHSC
jgi:hypothetical protein